MKKSRDGFIKNLHYFCLTGVIALGLMTIVATGGGGGGGGDGAVTPTEQTTDQATLSEENVNDSLEFVAENVPGCSFGSSVAGTQAVLGSVADLTQKVSNQVKFSSVSRPIRARDVETETIEFEGSCDPNPGMLTVTLSGDEDTGDLSGDVSFEDFCLEIEESESKINGYFEFSGKIDTETDELNQLSASTGPEGITLQEDGDTYTIGLQNGNMTIEEDTITATVESFYVKEVSGGETTEYRVENLYFQATEGDTETQIIASGQFIHPHEGTVDFTTLGPVTVSDEGEIVSGQVQISGAGSTQVLLSTSGGNVFEVRADTNGDGTFDYTSENLDCSEFDLDLDL